MKISRVELGSFGINKAKIWLTQMMYPLGTTLIQGGNVFAGFCLFVCLLASCLLYTSPSPRDRQKSRMPSSA